MTTQVEKSVSENLAHITSVIEHHLLQAHLQLTLDDAKIVRKLFTGKHVAEIANKIALSIAK